MKSKNINILIIVLVSIFLYSCETAKEALQGKKRSEQSDEFLVEKKNPLAMPPDFEKLPVPEEQEIANNDKDDSSKVKELLNIDESIDSENDSNESSNIEDSILDKIQ